MLDTRITAVVVLPTIYVFSTQTVADCYCRRSKPNLDKSDCAENLLEVYFAQNRFIAGHTGEYPLARAIVGLLAGALEAILADRLQNAGSKTLGGLITEASKGGVILAGTKPAALSSLMLCLRNYVHADRQASQIEYFIDMNVANGCRVALDWAVSEMLQAGQRQSSAAGSAI